jgi:Na+/phosphate symporter
MAANTPQEQETKDKRMVLTVGTAIGMLLVIINFGIWIGTKLTNTERDIREINKTIDILYKKEQVQDLKIEELQKNDNNTLIVLREIQVNLKNISDYVEKTNRKMENFK